MRLNHCLRHFVLMFLIWTPIAMAQSTMALSALQPREKSSRDPLRRNEIAKNYGKLPLSFEENQGQTDVQVRFLSRGPDYTLFLTESSAVLKLTRASLSMKRDDSERTDVVRMELLGASRSSTVRGEDLLPGVTNYFLGNHIGGYSDSYEFPVTTGAFQTSATQPGFVAEFTLESNGPIVATPTFSPAGGTYTSDQSIIISDSTSGATIYYTTDGSTPTANSMQYTGPINLTQTTTINAIATASGNSNSAVATATYTITVESQAATPIFSPAGGTYTSSQTVTISGSTTGAMIYYTADGSTPTASSRKYTGPITVSSTETINAIAVASGFSNSSLGTATYTITLPAAAPPAYSPAGGTYTSAQTVTVTDSTSGATIYYTTDGSTPTPSSTEYTGPITVSSSGTLNAIATASGYATSIVSSTTYTIILPPADFGIAASPASLTVTAGQNGTTAITVTPQNGFSSAVSFTCAGLPSGATCSFSPSTITPSGASAATTLTIATSSASASLHRTTNPFLPGGATLAVALCFLGFGRCRRLQSLLLLVICGIGIGWLSGCGSGSSNTGNSTTSTVTVTATSGALSHSATVSLTVD
jgi:hypothetical protein